MRDERRIDEILERIRVLWKRNPELRFFQLINAILAFDSKTLTKMEDYFYQEDDFFIERLKKAMETFDPDYEWNELLIRSKYERPID